MFTIRYTLHLSLSLIHSLTHTYTHTLFLSLQIQLNLMRDLRRSILEQRFPEFVQQFMLRMHPKRDYEQWAMNALASVGIHLR